MRYVQLRAFHHVALAGSFSQAARDLSLTQPAISDQVRWLEEEYDVPLFVRKRRQLTLTPAGTRLLAATRRLFDAEGEALDVLQEERSLRAGVLRIAADSVDHVLDVLTVYRERFPGIQIRIVGGNSSSIIEDLLAYDVNIGVLGELADERPFEVLSLNVSPVVLFAVTSTRIVLPLSAATSVYVVAVAPEMSAHWAPAVSQRCHWYANVSPVPVQVPWLAVNVWPTTACPVIAGG